MRREKMEVINWSMQDPDNFVLTFSEKIIDKNIYFEQRQASNTFFLPLRITGKVVADDKLAFPMIQFLQENPVSHEHNLFDLIYSGVRVVEAIKFPKKIDFQLAEKDGHSYMLYCNARKGVSLKIPEPEASKEEVALKEVFLDRDNLVILAESKLLDWRSISLIIKQRQASSIIEYVREVKIARSKLKLNGLEFRIPIDELLHTLSLGEILFDFYVELNGTQSPLLNNSYKKNLLFSDKIEGYFYSNYLGNTSMTLRQNQIVTKSISEEVDFILYKVINGSKPEMYIRDACLQQKTILDAVEYIIEHQSEMTYLLAVEENSMIYPVVFESSKIEEKFTNVFFQQKRYGTRMMCNERRQKKILVQGSCHSRLMFTANDFYNPNYKSYFHVPYTQFHSSLITLATSSYQGDTSCLNNLNERFEEYVKADLEKRMFDYLEGHSVDYLLIDLFVDAVRDEIIVGDSGITVNYMIRKNRDFLFKVLSEEGGSVLDKSNLEVYFDLWKPYANTYAKKIHKYLKDEQIILNRVKRTLKFKNKNGKIEQFQTNREYIKKTNVLLAMMEDYFISLFPGCKVLENQREYISDERHPEYASPDHLESQYYKDRMQELIRMVEYR